MLEAHLGEAAALATALCFTVSALAFNEAAKRLGSLALNLIRLVMALGLLTLYGALVRGQAWPSDATPRVWLFLSLSGLVGFTLGDMCLFRAYVELGPRLTTLLYALAPIFSAVLGWLCLGETLSAQKLGGMALTFGGIVWVLLERRTEAPRSSSALPTAQEHHYARGIILGVLAALGQAGGYLLTKYGLGNFDEAGQFVSGDYDACAATQIRVIAGALGFALLFFPLRWWPKVGMALKNGSGLKFAFLGALSGPFVGVSLGVVAVVHAKLGIAATLMSLVPIFVLPFAILVQKERVSVRAVVGALVAIGGVALMSLEAAPKGVE